MQPQGTSTPPFPQIITSGGDTNLRWGKGGCIALDTHCHFLLSLLKSHRHPKGGVQHNMHSWEHRAPQQKPGGGRRPSFGDEQGHRTQLIAPLLCLELAGSYSPQTYSVSVIHGAWPERDRHCLTSSFLSLLMFVHVTLRNVQICKNFLWVWTKQMTTTRKQNLNGLRNYAGKG